MIRFLESLVAIGLVCGVVGGVWSLVDRLLTLALREDDEFIAPVETPRRFRIMQGGRTKELLRADTRRRYSQAVVPHRNEGF